MNKAVIRAGGNIVSKFIESAELVEAGGNIEVILYCIQELLLKGRLKPAAKRGL